MENTPAAHNAAENAAENVGTEFEEDRLLACQAKTWQAIREVASMIRPGMTEADARTLLNDTLKKLKYEKIWHPPQIRFGANTVLPFGKPSAKDVVLQENDLFFLDIGPVFDGYEGDAGETFVVGDDEDLKRLAADAKGVFNDVRDHWKASGVSGRALYTYAQDVASKRGWRLSLDGASGHRVSDFPHAIHHRGKLRTFEMQPTANRWILEIHLFHPERAFGAFFEDLL